MEHLIHSQLLLITPEGIQASQATPLLQLPQQAHLALRERSKQRNCVIGTIRIHSMAKKSRNSSSMRHRRWRYRGLSYRNSWRRFRPYENAGQVQIRYNPRGWPESDPSVQTLYQNAQGVKNRVENLDQFGHYLEVEDLIEEGPLTWLSVFQVSQSLQNLTQVQ